jgi:hypothetical protein
MNNPVPTAAGGAARGRGATFSISISPSLSPSFGGGRGEVRKMLNSYGVLMEGETSLHPELHRLRRFAQGYSRYTPFGGKRRSR